MSPLGKPANLREQIRMPFKPALHVSIRADSDPCGG
jgi:hypothetical protein